VEFWNLQKIKIILARDSHLTHRFLPLVVAGFVQSLLAVPYGTLLFLPFYQDIPIKKETSFLRDFF